jgi:hypothetical protein
MIFRNQTSQRVEARRPILRVAYPQIENDNVLYHSQIGFPLTKAAALKFAKS